MRDLFIKACGDHQEAVKDSFNATGLDVLIRISDVLLTCFRSGHKVLLCGNGGSAADAQHIAAEFVGRFNRERKSMAAIALTTDTSILTAIANDYSYEDVFSRQVEGLGMTGDVLIAISTSGNSPNVLKAVRKAKAIGILTIGLSGADGGKLKSEADVMFCAASKYTPHIQEVHITALHAISEAVEKRYVESV